MATRKYPAIRADVAAWIEAGWVGAWRRLAGYTQPEAAREIGVSPRTLSRWETRQARPVSESHVRAYHACLVAWRRQARKQYPDAEW